MRLSLSLIVAAFATATPVASAQVSGATTSSPAQSPVVVSSIVTSAYGEARIAPDRATILLGVETRAATAQAAGSENAQRQRAVIDTLKALGIPAERIRSTEYTMYPEYVYDNEGQRRRITGYIARNTVQVEVRDIARVGPAIDAALAKGANTVNSLQFESSKADSVRRGALGEAVRKARADADAMASAAGRCIADVIELSTSEMVRPVMMAMGRAADTMEAAPTPIEPGEQVFSVTVTGRWQLHAIGAACSPR